MRPEKLRLACEEAIDIEDGLLSGFAGNQPFWLGGFFHQVGHVDAVAEAGDVVDIGGGGGPDVEDAQ